MRTICTHIPPFFCLIQCDLKSLILTVSQWLCPGYCEWGCIRRSHGLASWNSAAEGKIIKPQFPCKMCRQSFLLVARNVTANADEMGQWTENAQDWGTVIFTHNPQLIYACEWSTRLLWALTIIIWGNQYNRKKWVDSDVRQSQACGETVDAKATSSSECHWLARIYLMQQKKSGVWMKVKIWSLPSSLRR